MAKRIFYAARKVMDAGRPFEKAGKRFYQNDHSISFTVHWDLEGVKKLDMMAQLQYYENLMFPSLYNDKPVKVGDRCIWKFIFASNNRSEEVAEVVVCEIYNERSPNLHGGRLTKIKCDPEILEKLSKRNDVFVTADVDGYARVYEGFLFPIEAVKPSGCTCSIQDLCRRGCTFDRTGRCVSWTN